MVTVKYVMQIVYIILSFKLLHYCSKFYIILFFKPIFIILIALRYAHKTIKSNFDFSRFRLPDYHKSNKFVVNALSSVKYSRIIFRKCKMRSDMECKMINNYGIPYKWKFRDIVLRQVQTYFPFKPVFQHANLFT